MKASDRSSFLTRAVPAVILGFCLDVDIAAARPLGGGDGPRFTVSELRPNIQWSGRVNAIALHPSEPARVLVATESGGLFQSSVVDNWSHIESFPNMATNDVARWTADPNVVIATAWVDYEHLIATGARTVATSGGGIWISRDDAATWNHPDTAVPQASATMFSPSKCPDRHTAFGISFEPRTHHMYVATDCGVSISRDGGVTWTHKEIPYTRNIGDLGQIQFRAVAALGGGHVIIGGRSGVFYSADGGDTWHREITGIGIVDDIHAISQSGHDRTAFLVNNDQNLYVTRDGGRTWSRIDGTPPGGGGCGGIAFVKAVAIEPQNLVGRTTYDLYYGNRCRLYSLRARRGPFGPLPSNSGWTDLGNLHDDARDVALQVPPGPPTSKPPPAVPVFAANDGGLERSEDGGRTWRTIGSGKHGINALQVMDVAGQRIGSSRYDLAFGTQDTELWGSSDGGQTWPADRIWEGLGLTMERHVPTEAESRWTYVACYGCESLMSEPLFRNEVDWPDPPDGQSSPELVRRGTYLQHFNPSPGDSMQQSIALTANYGADWRAVAGIPLGFAGNPRIAGTSEHPVVYQPVRVGSVPETLFDAQREFPDIDLVRATDIDNLAGASVSYPAMNGFGSMGVMPTMWSWYPVFAVDSQDPLHLIAPDAQNGHMSQTWDGGENWTSMPELTDLVTQDGALSFVDRTPYHAFYFNLVSAISFNPDDASSVLLGARQGGVYQSIDGGRSWRHVTGSERITNVVDFNWISGNSAIVATYGRGLWKLSGEIPDKLARLPEHCAYRCRHIRVRPPRTHRNRNAAAPAARGAARFDTALLVLDGRIVDVKATEKAPLEASVTPGSTYLFLSRRGKGAHQPFDVSVVERFGKSATIGAFEGLPDVVEALDRKNGGVLVGLGMERGKVSAAIVADRELPLANRDHRRAAAPGKGKTSTPPNEGKPYITLSAPTTVMGRPILTSEGSNLTIRGRGFAPGEPVDIGIDGVQQKVRADVNATGAFSATVRLQLRPGPHRVVVRQVLGGGRVLTDADIFFAGTEDESHEKQERRDEQGESQR